MKIAVLGDGGWGTVLACLLNGNGHRVILWSSDRRYARFLDKKRTNPRYLPSASIPRRIVITSVIEKALAFSPFVVFAVPTQYLRSVLRSVSRDSFKRVKTCISCSKGIELKTFKLPTEIIAEFLPQARISCLSGPTIAREVYEKKPSCCIACRFIPLPRVR